MNLLDKVRTREAKSLKAFPRGYSALDQQGFHRAVATDRAIRDLLKQVHRSVSVSSGAAMDSGEGLARSCYYSSILSAAIASMTRLLTRW